MFLLALNSKFSAFIHHHKTFHWSLFLMVMRVHLSHDDLKSQDSWLEYSLSEVPGYSSCTFHLSSPSDFNVNGSNPQQIGHSWVEVHSYSVKSHFALHYIFRLRISLDMKKFWKRHFFRNSLQLQRNKLLGVLTAFLSPSFKLQFISLSALRFEPFRVQIMFSWKCLAQNY